MRKHTRTKKTVVQPHAIAAHFIHNVTLGRRNHAPPFGEKHTEFIIHLFYNCLCFIQFYTLTAILSMLMVNRHRQLDVWLEVLIWVWSLKELLVDLLLHTWW